MFHGAWGRRSLRGGCGGYEREEVELKEGREAFAFRREKRDSGLERARRFGVRDCTTSNSFI